MELVLYYIKESAILLISFLMLIFIFGTGCYLTIRKFRQNSRFKVTFYGLFFKLKNIDIVKIASVIIRTFLVIFSALVYSDNIYVFLIMIIMISFIYLVLTPKRFIYELICIIIQGITVYFIYVLNNYIVEMQNTMSLMIVIISLKVFIVIFAMYFFFKNIYEIVESRNIKELKNNGKVID